MSHLARMPGSGETDCEGRLGLEAGARRIAVSLLHPMLADHLMLYLSYKTHHWTITGPRFRELHLLFDEHAHAVLAAVDPLAERIAALGGTPLAAPSHLLVQASVAEPVAPCSAHAMLQHLRSETEELVVRLRGAIWEADAAGDPGTSDLLTGVLRQREAEEWVLSAVLAGER